ncbi:uncharacterized protein cubi_02204 [Cryptosporidium ubiquitum]|uniref:Uncharacterized protein n=1 Tax=Cryptosporidium ubiquitum TaxID=857276 RepID=A0A1J4MJE0_9CRYT|nr:uncharacterized protein cubi_02204 [Cryptosporidium ubiquitum]OII72973.1 hypothetical protein cubi_02204 [Cryptosporidium ubiquitum]
MSYTNNTNQIACQCGKQDKLLPVLPQSSNSRILRMMQQPGCGCMTPSSFSSGQNYYTDNQPNLLGCFYCQKAQHCCICDFSKRAGVMNQSNMLCSCCACPIQQFPSCQCGTNYSNIQQSSPMISTQAQITEITNSNGGNVGGNGICNGNDSTVPSTSPSGTVLVSTSLNSMPNQGQQIATQPELNGKSTSINPEMINIALSGQTPESLSISIDSRGVITLGVNNHPAPTSNISTSNSNEESRNRIRNALGDRH